MPRGLKISSLRLFLTGSPHSHLCRTQWRPQGPEPQWNCRLSGWETPPGIEVVGQQLQSPGLETSGHGRTGSGKGFQASCALKPASRRKVRSWSCKAQCVEQSTLAEGWLLETGTRQLVSAALFPPWSLTPPLPPALLFSLITIFGWHPHPWLSCLFQPLTLFLSYYFDVTFFLLWFFSLFSCSFCLHHCFCESLSLCQRYIQREYIIYTNEAWLKQLVNWASFTCYLECFLWGRWPFLEIKFYSLLLSDGLCIHFGKVENR